MKWLKCAGIYTLIFAYLSSFYQTMTPLILFHYPNIDFRYFLFILIQCFWSYWFYQSVYQYIIFYPMMRTRLTKWQCECLLCWRFMGFIVFYVGMHVILFFCFSLTMPWSLLTINLLIWLFVFIALVKCHRLSSYHYVSMIFIILCIHFIV